MYDPARHEDLIERPWYEAVARSAIEEIVADTYARFDRARLWPTHPLDGKEDGLTMLYFGAAGVIWTLHYLARAGVTHTRREFGAILPELIERNRADFKQTPYPRSTSYLIGDVALLLLQWRLAPSRDVANQLFNRINANTKQPVLELMWGSAGTMVAALFMAEWTGAARWQTVFREQADRLWNEWQEQRGLGCLWTQNLYGQSRQYLGPVHGFAGNVLALLRGQELLASDKRTQLHTRVAETLAKTAFEDANHVNWPAVWSSTHLQRPHLVQYCHGAPGMVTALAGLPCGFDPAVDRLLEKAGELTWAAGPLTKGPSLCHGTAGNGYAFLKLYCRTGNRKWLERARAFAVHAIAQCAQAREAYGQGRYSLWTGDLGLAVYLWDCMNEQASFPSIDIF
ncbi:MAG: LanC-like protein [Acidiferrobacterales bacterium]